ncbi:MULTISPECIES: hypothetical protein [Paracoccus]|uniref:hypothetical protein n=1 Tax=Paracoccus TaxID=265 RepID=UPI0011C3473E|nr:MULTISPECIES: hypothetical protein [Paracoccus]
MLPNSGRKLPKMQRAPTEAEYIVQISNALRGELGGTGMAVKTIMRWTGVSDRSARTWMNGSGSPSGYHLLRLARECDAVFEVLLDFTDHPEARLGFDLHAAEVAIARAMGAFEALRRQRSGGGSARRPS